MRALRAPINWIVAPVHAAIVFIVVVVAVTGANLRLQVAVNNTNTDNGGSSGGGVGEPCTPLHVRTRGLDLVSLDAEN